MLYILYYLITSTFEADDVMMAKVQQFRILRLEIHLRRISYIHVYEPLSMQAQSLNLTITMCCCCRESIYVAPSGVQKERLRPEDMFIIDLKGDELSVPLNNSTLSKSQCTPLFLLAYKSKLSGWSGCAAGHTAGEGAVGRIALLSHHHYFPRPHR